MRRVHIRHAGGARSPLAIFERERERGKTESSNIKASLSVHWRTSRLQCHTKWQSDCREFQLHLNMDARCQRKCLDWNTASFWCFETKGEWIVKYNQLVQFFVCKIFIVGLLSRTSRSDKICLNSWLQNFDRPMLDQIDSLFHLMLIKQVIDPRKARTVNL